MNCLTTELTHPDDRHMNDVRFGLGLWRTMTVRNMLFSRFSSALSCGKYDVYLLSFCGTFGPEISNSASRTHDWINSGKGFAMHQSLAPVGTNLFLVAKRNNESLAHVRDYLLKLANVNAVMDLCP